MPRFVISAVRIIKEHVTPEQQTRPVYSTSFKRSAVSPNATPTSTYSQRGWTTGPQYYHSPRYMPPHPAAAYGSYMVSTAPSLDILLLGSSSGTVFGRYNVECHYFGTSSEVLQWTDKL
ncbi:hypothetical protein NP493_832g00005 [Ridgeia piscesae]|uniref:Uncharacterized protein n=1 Tax=Ridgeia piscesae TaxID=27915 RepID=A0AAD9NKV1_RIDPI|nr:hypothetical protein NP493_832g00005 [Ridgeia piscesae]